jgi:hypothetical protein
MRRGYAGTALRAATSTATCAIRVGRHVFYLTILSKMKVFFHSFPFFFFFLVTANPGNSMSPFVFLNWRMKAKVVNL